VVDSVAKDEIAHIVSIGEETIVARVGEDCSATTLALALGMSRVSADAALRRGLVRRADWSALAGASRVAAGETVEVLLEPSATARPTTAAPADVVWEDPLALLADKPAGLLVHGDGTGAGTLSDRVQAHLAAEGSHAVAQAVQRLDVETTGLVLFSKTEQFQPAFDALVAGNTMQKRYLAVVMGSFPQGETSIEQPIGRDRHDARRMRVSPAGKHSLTRVTRLATENRRSLLLVELATGRRHQIRVHLASLGFPVVGDTLYGGARSEAGLMLHAWEERFVHPVTGEALCLRTPWPARFGSWEALASGI